LDLLEKKSS